MIGGNERSSGDSPAPENVRDFVEDEAGIGIGGEAGLYGLNVPKLGGLRSWVKDGGGEAGGN